MGDIEFGSCDVCKTETSLMRKYFYYNVQCDCCNDKEDNHFEIVRHCSSCEPTPPKTIKIWLNPIQ